DKLLSIRPFYHAVSTPTKRNAHKHNYLLVHFHPMIKEHDRKIHDFIDRFKISFISLSVYQNNKYLMKLDNNYFEKCMFLNKKYFNGSRVTVTYCVTSNSFFSNDLIKTITNRKIEFSLIENINCKDSKYFDNSMYSNITISEIPSKTGGNQTITCIPKNLAEYYSYLSTILTNSPSGILSNYIATRQNFLQVVDQNVFANYQAKDFFKSVNSNRALTFFQFKTLNDLINALFIDANPLDCGGKSLKRLIYPSYTEGKVLFPHVLAVSGFIGTADNLKSWLQPFIQDVIIKNDIHKNSFLVYTSHIDDCERILSLNRNSFSQPYLLIPGLYSVTIDRYYKTCAQNSFASIVNHKMGSIYNTKVISKYIKYKKIEIISNTPNMLTTYGFKPKALFDLFGSFVYEGYQYLDELNIQYRVPTSFKPPFYNPDRVEIIPVFLHTRKR
ncbi:hypothetical protein MXB_2242, partial [Myxobolus squamalis]